jgi:hypothetical protein
MRGVAFSPKRLVPIVWRRPADIPACCAAFRPHSTGILVNWLPAYVVSQDMGFDLRALYRPFCLCLWGFPLLRDGACYIQPLTSGPGASRIPCLRNNVA